MDEGLLNDLLECSVCLERLDTSSRVLPCQHTFCLKCLKVIVESHKELRCPECRVLVETKVEELPPNVLLMRILEGMRNSAPRKAGGTQRAARALQITKMQQGIMQLRDGKPVPPHARAMHDYSSKEMGDLSFKKGETIILQKKLDPHWYHGECSGRSGIFPITYVQIIVPLPVPTALCKALYDFRMSAPDEEGCLAFDKGTIITVHRRVDENWAEGRVDHRVGIFPIAFVELNQAAGHLMNSAPLNRVVPPIPDQARAHSEHRHHTQHPHRYQPMTSSLPAQNPYQNVPALGPARHYQPQFVPHVGAAKPEMGPTGIAVPVAGKRTDYDRIRGVKFEYNTTIQQSNYQPAHCPAVSSQSDSSSSVNTPSGSTTTPNTSSDTSTCESVPSSPDNNTNNTMNSQTNDETNDLNNTTTAVAILNLNESSTATNTSLNVSLPPTESPKMNASTSNSVQHNDDSVTNESVTNDSLTNNEPCSSRSGPDSLLTFGKGLQAVLLSQKEGYSRQLYRDKEKRHSLTPSTHLHGNHSTQNRHSAEILATSLLDGAPASELRTERSRRRRERSLPAAYVAIYPYKPQKPDELELKKGSIYTVTERCRDGWYKGWADRSQRTGVFPGNYVAPHADKVSPRGAPLPPPPPDAPPRADTPHAGQPLSYPWSSQQQSQSLQTTPRMEKPKDKPKPDKSGVSLMKRLAAMKKCKSPPPAYSLDNPVFDDGPHEGLMSLPTHQHVRSNSDSPWQSQHRKSQSLDVTVSRRDRHHAQTVKERFRCIVPYPPNSEYELELKLDDIVIVSKKRADGWYKGTLQRTGRTGLFPASFVQSYQE